MTDNKTISRRTLVKTGLGAVAAPAALRVIPANAQSATIKIGHVSPKTGRAVSRAAAQPYLDKLFALPAFLIDEEAEARRGDIEAAFALTGYFLDRHVWMPRQIDPPATREPLLLILSGAPAHV